MNSSSPMLIPILLGAGVLTRQQLEIASELAAQKQLSLEQALLESGLAKPEKLKASTDALAQVEDKRISLDLAIRAVRMASQRNMPLSEAIVSINRMRPRAQGQESRGINELGQILVSAQILDSAVVDSAIKSTESSFLCLGQTLLLDESIDVETLLNALNAVLMIRESGLDKTKAAKALRHANKRKLSFEQALFEMGDFIHPDSKIIRLGELLEMSSLLSRSELAECMEIEMFDDRDFGHVLLERELITEEQLEAAKTLRGSISSGTLLPYQAAEALRSVCLEGKDVYATMAIYQLLHKADKNDRLGELLIGSGALSEEQLDKALEIGKTESIKLGVALLKSESVSEAILYCALRLQTLIRFGYIPQTRAIELLSECHDKDCSLEVAFENLSIRVPSRMQWTWV